LFRRVLSYIGLAIGFALGYSLMRRSYEEGIVLEAAEMSGLESTFLGETILVPVLGGLFGAIIFFFLTPFMGGIVGRAVSVLELRLKTVATQDLALVVFALFIALVIGILISIPLAQVGNWGIYLSLVICALLAYLGIRFVLSRKEEFSFITSLFGRKQWQSAAGEPMRAKVLDTSVIIDGRIIDICKAGFMEGTIIVPEFVLEELRHIADSPDLLKRNRGRRGLDILNQIQKDLDNINVKIYEGDFEDIAEVDSKLVKLAKILKGKIVTNDYNLNKVCELQGVEVLNINELANAVKPVVLPGEEMKAQIIKDGKEAGQGVAYLDDGTMVVVESGKKYIGETIEVLVTSVLQTAAGRMIFAKPKNASEKITGVK